MGFQSWRNPFKDKDFQVLKIWWQVGGLGGQPFICLPIRWFSGGKALKCSCRFPGNLEKDGGTP